MNFYSDILKSLGSNNNLRTLPEDTANTDLIDLSSNDYLGIGADDTLHREFFNSMGDIPALSACASRLLATHQQEFLLLEQLLSGLYNRYVLLFNSGYHANVGAVSALAAGNTLIVADKLVHASIIDGMTLSRARFVRFKHNDVGHLQEILAKNAHHYDRVLIVCESVYSMDGDVAPIEEIAASKTSNSLLYVDEAHAFGVMGRSGLGLGVDIQEVDVLIGTLGKAAASVGAFVAVNDKTLRSYLINRARPFIFSTALPPINCAWSRFVIERIVGMDDRRNQLRTLNKWLGNLLGVQYPTHIIPFIVGSSKLAIELSKELLKNGFKVLPIRTPTVPAGTERLRFSLSANIDLKQLQPLENIIHI